MVLEKVHRIRQRNFGKAYFINIFNAPLFSFFLAFAAMDRIIWILSFYTDYFETTKVCFVFNFFLIAYYKTST